MNGEPGGFGRMNAQTERITTSISQQISGWFWSVLFAVFAIFTAWAIIAAVGPSSVWFIVQVVILWLAWIMLRGLGDYDPATDADRQFMRALALTFCLFAIALSVAWWYFPLREWWPPFFPELPVWKLAVIISFAIIPLLFSGLMSFAFIVGAINPASYAPYRARNPAGRLWDVLRPTDPPEEFEDETVYDAGEVETAPVAPCVIERLVVENLVKSNGNGNGHTAQSQNPGLYYFYRRHEAGETWLHAPEREYRNGDMALAKLRYVKMSDLARFVRESDSRGTSCQSWYQVWASKEYWRESNNVLRRLGILGPAMPKSDSALLVPKSRAMEILAALNMQHGDAPDLVKVDPPTG